MAGYGSAGNGGYGGYEHTHGLGQDKNEPIPVNEGAVSQDTGEQQQQFAKKTPFFATSTSTQEYIKALQKMVGAPITGVWDVQTHNALWVWWQANAGGATPDLVVAGGTQIPAFGTDPDRAGRVAIQPLLDAGDPQLFGLYVPLLQLLNLPTTNAQDYMTVMKSNVDAVESAMKAIQDHVVAQEKAGAEAAVAAAEATEAAAAAAAAAATGPTATATTSVTTTTTPTPGAVAVPAKSYTWVWWLVGAAAVGGLVWALARKKGEDEAMPEPEPVPTGEFGKVRIPRKGGAVGGCGCGG